MLSHDKTVWVVLTSANGSDHEASVFVGEEFSRIQVLAKALTIFDNSSVLNEIYLSAWDVTRTIEDIDATDGIDEFLSMEEGKFLRQFKFKIGQDTWEVFVMEFITPILIYPEQ